MHILFIYNISGELLVDAMTTGFRYTLNQKILAAFATIFLQLLISMFLFFLDTNSFRH